MARINLLPWRQEERLRKNKEFNVMAAAAAVLAALISLLALTHFNNQLSNQQSANEMIVNENKRLEAKLEEIKVLETQRDEMVSRMKIIQDLQGRRSVPVRIWDDIARAVPSNMYLVGIKREDDTITLTGFADNNNVVSQLVRNLDASPWLGDSLIPQIKTNVQAYASGSENQRRGSEAARGILPEDNYVEFTVTTKVKSDVKGEGTATDAQAAPAAATPVAAAPSTAVPPTNADSAATAPQQAPVQPEQGTAAVASPQEVTPVIADTTPVAQSSASTSNGTPMDNSKNAPATPSVVQPAQPQNKAGTEQKNSNAPATSQIHQTNTGGQS